MSSTPPSLQGKKKSSKKKIVLIVLLSLICVCVVCAVAGQIWIKSPKGQEMATQRAMTETARPTKTAKPIVIANPTKTPNPAVTTMSTKTTNPTSTTKPTKTTRPTSTTKPTKTPRSTSTSRLTRTPNPTATTRPTRTPNPTPTPKPTKTPRVNYTPTATGTPAKPLSSITFEEIVHNSEIMTQAQWIEYTRQLAGTRIKWTGKVADVTEHTLLGDTWYQVDICVGSNTCYQDVLFTYPKELSLRLLKGQEITFQGDIDLSGVEDKEMYLFRVIVRLENPYIYP